MEHIVNITFRLWGNWMRFIVFNLEFDDAIASIGRVGINCPCNTANATTNPVQRY